MKDKIKMFNTKYKIQDTRYKLNGFTLIELLITISIIAVIATVGILNLSGNRQERDVNFSAQEIITVLRNAQDRSIAQEEGSRWGVYFYNWNSDLGIVYKCPDLTQVLPIFCLTCRGQIQTGSTCYFNESFNCSGTQHFYDCTLINNDFYELFKGQNYVGGTVVSKIALRSNIQFDIPVSGSSSTIIFAPITGLPNTSTTIKISLIGKPTSSSTIIINTNGEIRY